MEAQRGQAIFLRLHSKSAPKPGLAPPPLWTSPRSAPPGLTGWGRAPISLSPFLTSQHGFSSPRTKCRTYHDVIPISCLTEFPNVVQMAKVRHLPRRADPCRQPLWAQSWAAAWLLQTLGFSPRSWPGCCGLSLGLNLHAASAGGEGSIPGQGTKVLHALRPEKILVKKKKRMSPLSPFPRNNRCCSLGHEPLDVSVCF